MSEQPTSGNSGNNNRAPGSGGPNNNRRHHHRNRRPQGGGGPRPPQQGGQSQGTPQAGPRPQQQGAAPQGPRQTQQPGSAPQGARAGQQSGNPGGQSQGQRRRNRGHNRPRNPNPEARQNSNNTQGINIERIYEKYLNLLDQHLIARRKYHDLFYRADPAQKNKLERNFYNSLNEVRDYENKLSPEARELFERRNNGLCLDTIYTTNHEIESSGENPPPQSEWADPHFLHSQKTANYAEDKEESTGTLDDYLKYKNLV